MIFGPTASLSYGDQTYAFRFTMGDSLEVVATFDGSPLLREDHNIYGGMWKRLRYAAEGNFYQLERKYYRRMKEAVFLW